MVTFDSGFGELNEWGQILIEGTASATVRSFRGVDVPLPPSIAEGLIRDYVILNSDSGVILVLPYDGEEVATIVLDSGELKQLAQLSRDADKGMRIAGIRLPPLGGVLFICECSVIFFRADFEIAWRLDGDFSRWSLAGVDDRHFLLLASEFSGEDKYERRSLVDGRVSDPAQ